MVVILSCQSKCFLTAAYIKRCNTNIKQKQKVMSLSVSLIAKEPVKRQGTGIKGNRKTSNRESVNQ